MASSVLLKGLPRDVPIKVLAYHLDKVLDTDDIGTFKVKELTRNSSNKSQVIINFKSSYDAFTAQSILQGFRYKWTDDEEYVLQAKVVVEPSLQCTNWHELANETWGQSSSTLLIAPMSQVEARSCNAMLDMKLDLLRKQKLLLQTQRGVLVEKRKLEKEYRKRHISDSEEEDTKLRPRKKKRGRRVDCVRASSDETGPGSTHKSKSRSSSISRSRSRAATRSVARDISPDHSRSRTGIRSVNREMSPSFSRSRAVSRSIVRDIPSYKTCSSLSSPDSSKALAVYKPPDHARLGPIPGSSKAYDRSTDPEYFDSYRRPSTYHSRSPVRPRSPDSPSYGRCKSRDYSKLYRPYRHPDSMDYRRPRSPEYPEFWTRSRRRSPDSMHDRDRYREYYQSHSRLRSHYSRSPEYSRSSRRSRDYVPCDESRDRFTSDKGRDKGRRYDDNEYNSSRDNNTNTRIIDISIQVKRKKPTTEPAKNINTSAISTETVTNIDEPEETEHTATDNVAIKTEYDIDNKDEDFKLQVNIAIRVLMTSLQGLLDVAQGIREKERNSLVKTLHSIVVKRLRCLPLDQNMISEDIVHVYRYTHADKEGALITKLIEQLSDPKIVIEDSDMAEPPDADNKIWSILDQVLEDFKIEYFSDDDDARTVIVDNYDSECGIDNNPRMNEVNIKTEKMDADIKPNIPQMFTDRGLDANLVDSVAKPKRNKKKHGPRNKIDTTEDITEKKIPPNPKFVITVNKVLKKMKPYIYEHRGDMNVLRILDVTTYEIRRKIRKLVEGKSYMKSSDITKLYRERYPKDKDLEFVWNIMEKFKNGGYRDMTMNDIAENIENDNMDSKFIETKQNVTEESDDVIIVERSDVIMVVDDDGDDVLENDVKPGIAEVPQS